MSLSPHRNRVVRVQKRVGDLEPRLQARTRAETPRRPVERKRHAGPLIPPEGRLSYYFSSTSLIINIFLLIGGIHAHPRVSGKLIDSQALSLKSDSAAPVCVSHNKIKPLYPTQPQQNNSHRPPKCAASPMRHATLVLCHPTPTEPLSPSVRKHKPNGINHSRVRFVNP